MMKNTLPKKTSRPILTRFQLTKFATDVMPRPAPGAA